MSRNDAAGANLRTGIELAGATLLMMREHFRRQHPKASEDELTALVNDWLNAKHAGEFDEPAFRVRRPVSL